MKLFSASQTVSLGVTMESFRQYHGTAAVISIESMSTFLGQVKDVFGNSLNAFKTDKEEQFIQDTLQNKFQVLAKVKEINMNDIRYDVISKPESFKGLYSDYLKDLIQVSAETRSLFNSSAILVKTAVANFINEYSDDKADQIYGYSQLKQAEVKLEKYKKVIGDYFPLPANKVKTTPPEVIKSLSEIEELFKLLEKLSTESINPEEFKNIEKQVTSVSELVDVLIQHNVNSGVLLKNNTAKQQLIECVTILAHLSEFYSSLYARTVVYCNAFKSLTDAIKLKDK